MQAKTITIYGGGFAREVAWLVQACNEGVEVCRVACFIDDDPTLHGKVLNGIPVVSLKTARERFPETAVVGGIGSPQTRQRLMEKAAAAGFGHETIVHPRVERSEWIAIGAGTVICAGTSLPRTSPSAVMCRSTWTAPSATT